MQTRPALLSACIAFIAFVATGNPSHADDLFRDKIAPLLERRCLSCHNENDRKGEFSLQTPQHLRDSGHVEPGKPDESRLLSVVIPESACVPPTMPKDADPLTVEEVAMLRQWISDGAKWPDTLILTEPVVDNFDWWSLRPITPVTPP
ncbi:MAG: hypothetical protein H7Z17_20615, partial [Fuerstia sp.]|nr:hypothetical protein [Fuerstiella sp.]